MCSINLHMYFTSLLIKFLLVVLKMQLHPPLLKANYRLKFSQDVAMNSLIENGKPQIKLSYNVFKEQYGYDSLLDISQFPTFIHLKEFIGGIRHCVTVVGKCIFDSYFPFELPLTQEDLKYCCINDTEAKY